MKLFQRYNRINLLSTVIIFLLSLVSFYVLLHYVLVDQLDENLEIEKNEIDAYVVKYNKLPDSVVVADQSIRYEVVAHLVDNEMYKTIKMYDAVEKETNDFRQLIFGTTVNGQPYKIIISKSLEGTEHISRTIILIAIVTILLILIINFIINRVVLRKLWQPFYHTLEMLAKFKLGQKNDLHIDSTTIDEFVKLNADINRFISKAESDYNRLKEFTENASHELQTPIAVIRSKLDVLIQDEHLTEAQSVNISSAYDALLKLSRLNQSLLLLSKIENRQFAQKDFIDLKTLFRQKIFQFQELWQSKNLLIETTLENATTSLNKDLADILLNNLFSNVTRHTPAGGKISIHLDEDKFCISNTAAGLSLDENKLFDRFYKKEQSADGQGLGLSIIKQICETSGCEVVYTYKDHQHLFTVVFKK